MSVSSTCHLDSVTFWRFVFSARGARGLAVLSMTAKHKVPRAYEQAEEYACSFTALGNDEVG